MAIHFSVIDIQSPGFYVTKLAISKLETERNIRLLKIKQLIQILKRYPVDVLRTIFKLSAIGL